MATTDLPHGDDKLAEFMEDHQEEVNAWMASPTTSDGSKESDPEVKRAGDNILKRGKTLKFLL